MGFLQQILLVLPSLWALTVAYPSRPHTAGRACSELQVPPLPGIQVLSFSAIETPEFTIPPVALFLPEAVTVPPICNVTITLTHTGVNDTVKVEVWLPLSNWNSRFISLGGSGWAAGHGPLTLGPAVAQGFAAGSTDAGLLGSDPTTPKAWALTPDGEANHGLLTNFASRSVHDMTVIGKALSAAFYGRKPTTYWSGCSTGGRQGLVAAQQYPELFDGILAGAPAIYWPTYIVAELWPQVVMREAGLYPSQEEFNAVIAAAVTVCDEADGVKDGVVTEPDKCNFDPHSVTGNVNVNGTEVEITPEIADVIKKIWEGPDIDGQKLWYGLPIGSSFDQLANTVVENGTKAGVPFYVANDWTRFFLEQDATYDVSRLDTESLKNLFYSSQIKYDDLINNANPDLSGLQRSGAKLLVWHGGADQIIFPQGTTQYRKRVEDAMGGTATVDEFFRYFLAPGVDHCGIGGAPGAAPTNLLETLIAWTENGTAPVKLHGETPANFPAFTRNICKYPLLPKYTGEGNINSADSFVCV